MNRAALTLTALVASMISMAELAGQSAPADAALHVLPLQDNRTKSEGMLRDYVRIIESGATRRQFESVVHGALRVYDLPDLATLAGKVTFVEPMDASGRPAGR